jgi:GT2 family glycosyltransferase
MAVPVVAGAGRVWIVLVNWNGWRDTLECLESVFRLDHPDFGVILCDNASSDGSLSAIADWAAGRVPYQAPIGPLARLSTPALPKPLDYRLLASPAAVTPDALASRLLIVPTGANLGFAGGNNVGIRIALADPACDYVWLLNNDTVVETDTLDQMLVQARSDAAIGITGSVNCFYAEPNRVQALGGGFFSRRRVRGGLYGHGLPADAVDPDLLRRIQSDLQWVSGASMLVSRAFLEQVGEMEERYFLYFEEIDWAWRAAPRFRNALASAARVYHKAGSSTGEQVDSSFAIYTLYRSRHKLYRKFMPSWLAVCHLLALKDAAGAALRGRHTRAAAIVRAGRDDLFRS